MIWEFFFMIFHFTCFDYLHELRVFKSIKLIMKLFSFQQTTKVEMSRRATSQRRYATMSCKLVSDSSSRTIMFKIELNTSNRWARSAPTTRARCRLWPTHPRLTCREDRCTRSLRRRSAVVSRLDRCCRCRFLSTAMRRQTQWEDDTRWLVRNATKLLLQLLMWHF